MTATATDAEATSALSSHDESEFAARLSWMPRAIRLVIERDIKRLAGVLRNTQPWITEEAAMKETTARYAALLAPWAPLLDKMTPRTGFQCSLSRSSRLPAVSAKTFNPAAGKPNALQAESTTSHPKEGPNQ